MRRLHSMNLDLAQIDGAKIDRAKIDRAMIDRAMSALARRALADAFTDEDAGGSEPEVLILGVNSVVKHSPEAGYQTINC